MKYKLSFLTTLMLSTMSFASSMDLHLLICPEKSERKEEIIWQYDDWQTLENERVWKMQSFEELFVDPTQFQQVRAFILSRIPILWNILPTNLNNYQTIKFDRTPLEKAQTVEKNSIQCVRHLPLKWIQVENYRFLDVDQSIWDKLSKHRQQTLYFLSLIDFTLDQSYFKAKELFSDRSLLSTMLLGKMTMDQLLEKNSKTWIWPLSSQDGFFSGFSRYPEYDESTNRVIMAEEIFLGKPNYHSAVTDFNADIVSFMVEHLPHLKLHSPEYFEWRMRVHEELERYFNLNYALQRRHTTFLSNEEISKLLNQIIKNKQLPEWAAFHSPAFHKGKTSYLWTQSWLPFEAKPSELQKADIPKVSLGSKDNERIKKLKIDFDNNISNLEAAHQEKYKDELSKALDELLPKLSVKYRNYFYDMNETTFKKQVAEWRRIIFTLYGDMLFESQNEILLFSTIESTPFFIGERGVFEQMNNHLVFSSFWPLYKYLYPKDKAKKFYDALKDNPLRKNLYGLF